MSKEEQKQLLAVGQSIKVLPYIGESWPQYKARIKQKKPDFSFKPIGIQSDTCQADAQRYTPKT